MLKEFRVSDWTARFLVNEPSAANSASHSTQHKAFLSKAGGLCTEKGGKSLPKPCYPGGQHSQDIHKHEAPQSCSSRCRQCIKPAWPRPAVNTVVGSDVCSHLVFCKSVTNGCKAPGISPPPSLSSERAPAALHFAIAPAFPLFHLRDESKKLLSRCFLRLFAFLNIRNIPGFIKLIFAF